MDFIGGHSDFKYAEGKTLTVAGQRQIFTELSPLRLMSDNHQNRLVIIVSNSFEYIVTKGQSITIEELWRLKALKLIKLRVVGIAIISFKLNLK